jgi:pimeloyl-ACP methyl ester carboxylesterase
MDHHAVSSDGARIHYQVTGTGSTALVFVHGWLGNAAWWNAQRDFFADRYTVVQIDLAGHGASDRSRTAWSAELYAHDIKAVAEQLDARDIVLLGHSMSGAYVLVASTIVARTKAVILVDTLKNLDQIMSPQQSAQIIDLYRADFRSAVENVLPQHLFSKSTPAEVRSRIQNEFLTCAPGLAIQIIEPLYRMDVREAAHRVTVPVRAINADFTPTSGENNRTYFRDYDYVTIAGCGHYPMLERPDEFNRILDDVLRTLGFSTPAAT